MAELKAISTDSFRGKTILITGASGGLGSALARNLATCGPATLILSGRREDALKQISMECTTSNPQGNNLQIETITCDLDDPKSVEKLATKALECCPGGIDVLINNGGVSSRSNFVDTSIEVDQRVMQINFFSGAALAKAVVPGMRKKGSGRIIWISSVQGLVGIPSRTSYAASKFAVQGYCESLRAELASSGVTVHVVSPGYIRTNLSTSALTGDGKPYGIMDATTAAGADPEEVAITVLNKVAAGEADFTVAASFSAIAAIWLRLLCPGILRGLLVKRFEKSQKGEKDKND